MPDLVDCVALDLAACNNWFSQNKFYTYITLVDPSQCSFFHLKKKKKKRQFRKTLLILLRVTSPNFYFKSNLLMLHSTKLCEFPIIMCTWDYFDFTEGEKGVKRVSVCISMCLLCKRPTFSLYKGHFKEQNLYNVCGYNNASTEEIRSTFLIKCLLD